MRPESDRPLSVLLVTDVFPPRSGGSGWSTYYLGKALAERGHHVEVLMPLYGESGSITSTRTNYGGLPVTQIAIPRVPGWARKIKLDKAWLEQKAIKRLARQVRVRVARGTEVVHGQHMVSSVATALGVQSAGRAGRKAVSVATIRDYWPLCPSSTRLFRQGDGAETECTECNRLSPYIRCAAGSRRRVASYPISVARWFRTRTLARTLSKCDAVIAVSRYVRDELARSNRVPVSKLAVLPNMVDLASVQKALTGDWPLPDVSPDQPFLLFAGKLESNKGAHMLPAALGAAEVQLPIIIVGEGPLASHLERDAQAGNLDMRFYQWIENDALLLLMKQARALLFPSAWSEPLSRVLLEGCAAGACIVALDTGGTSDILRHLESGWLASDMKHFARGISTVCRDENLNAQLRVGALARAESDFASHIVSARVEALYRELLAGGAT